MHTTILNSGTSGKHEGMEETICKAATVARLCFFHPSLSSLAKHHVFSPSPSLSPINGLRELLGVDRGFVWLPTWSAAEEAMTERTNLKNSMNASMRNGCAPALQQSSLSHIMRSHPASYPATQTTFPSLRVRV